MSLQLVSKALTSPLTHSIAPENHPNWTLSPDRFNFISFSNKAVLLNMTELLPVLAAVPPNGVPLNCPKPVIFVADLVRISSKVDVSDVR